MQILLKLNATFRILVQQKLAQVMILHYLKSNNIALNFQTETEKMLCVGVVRQTQSAWFIQTKEPKKCIMEMNFAII